jgi:hypothetical protein
MVVVVVVTGGTVVEGAGGVDVGVGSPSSDGGVVVAVMIGVTGSGPGCTDEGTGTVTGATVVGTEVACGTGWAAVASSAAAARRAASSSTCRLTSCWLSEMTC